MYYEILKEMNPRMKLAMADGRLYVLKEIGLEDTEMYQKLIRLDCKNIVRFYDTVAQDGRFYAVEEFINGGSTLRAYLERRGPLSDLETKNIALQICNGLKQVHKLGIVHRDINPNNIMLAADGTVKIIDFGAVHVAGLAETAAHGGSAAILGTVQYTAPEYFWGGPGTPQSDLFSLGVITYQMLTGRLPYGTQVAGLRTRAALTRLRYASALHDESRPIPAWIDAVLERAVHPNPLKRQAELSEFVHELHQPGAATLARTRQPLAERNPLVFWRATALVLAITVVVLLGFLHRQS